MAFLTREKRLRTGATVYVLRWREGGKQRRRRVGTDRRVAEAARADAEHMEQEARGAYQEAQDGPALVGRFLGAMAAKGLRAPSLDYYGRRLRAWLVHVGETPPARWTRAGLDAFLAAHPGWSPRTAAIHVAALRRFVRWARKAGAYVPSITDGVELPRVRPPARTPLQPAQVDALMAVAAGHRYAPAVALAAYAGLSLGDVRTLTWAEVDLESGWIVRAAGRRKTGEPVRVPILPPLADALRAALPKPTIPPTPLVGSVCTGLPKGRAVYRTLQGLYTRAGLPAARGWHLLRHSFGTLLMRAGVPTPMIGRLLSHRPGSVVTAQYQHPDDADLVQAMASLRAYMERARAKG